MMYVDDLDDDVDSIRVFAVVVVCRVVVSNRTVSRS